MLLVPEYLLFTIAEPGANRIAVSVEFDDPVARMPERYIDCDLLSRMIRAVSQGTLRFMSFDEHPKRVAAITKAGRHAVITARSLTPSDHFPTDWTSTSVEHWRDMLATAPNG